MDTRFQDQSGNHLRNIGNNYVQSDIAMKNTQMDTRFQDQSGNHLRNIGNNYVQSDIAMKNTQMDTRFQDQSDNHLRNIGNNYVQNGIAMKNTISSQNPHDSQITNIQSKKVLGASMALAAKNNKNRKNTKHGIKYGKENQNILISGQQMATNIGQIYRNIQENQERSQSQENYMLNTGLVPNTVNNAIRTTDLKHDAIKQRINNVNNIVKGLKEGSASSKRKIADQIITDYQLAATADYLQSSRNGFTPYNDYNQNSRQTELLPSNIDSSLFKQETGDGISTHIYTSKMQEMEHRVALGEISYANQWGKSDQNYMYHNAVLPTLERRALTGQYTYEPTRWQASSESFITSSKTPELEHRMQQANVGVEPTQWRSSEETQFGKVGQLNTQQSVQHGQHSLIGHWNNGYDLQQIGKTLALPTRRSANSDPVVLGGTPNELFGASHEFATGALIVGPKSLRSDRLQEDNDHRDDHFNDNTNLGDF